MKLTQDELIKATGGTEVDIKDTVIGGISIDSRTTKPKDVFFAIKGERYDGQDFVKEAEKKGCLFSVVERNIGRNAVVVKDTKKALYDLAFFYRRKFNPLTIAITGSNGKTTAKNLTYAVLKRRFNVLVSPKSYNNNIGIPITIFNLKESHQVLLLELGTNHKGEIGSLCELVSPKIGVITNIGPAHLENFSSIEEIFKEKIALANACQIILLNGDDSMLSRFSDDNKRVIRFGIKNGDIKAEDVKITPLSSTFRVDRDIISLLLAGRHNIYNALAAIKIGNILEIKRSEIKDSLKEVTPIEGRERVIQRNGIIIIDSSYNSNPDSLLAMLLCLQNFSGRRIAVLGDMLELGRKSAALHRKIGSQLTKFGVDVLFTYGELAEEFGAGFSNVFSYKDIERLIKALKNFTNKGDVVLIKGSRKMGMERVVEEMGNVKCGMWNVKC